MADVLLARKADSKGYTRLTLADPIGQPQAGEVVVMPLKSPVKDANTGEEVSEVTLILHGVKEFDIPDGVASVQFPDGSSYKPKG